MWRFGFLLMDAGLVVLSVGAFAAAPDSPGLPPAAMKHWTSDNGNGTYSNPLFYEEFEDPDVIRVGEDFYLAGTTMHMNPAVQLMHSKDLVNWKLAGYCMDRLDLGRRSGSNAEISTAGASGRPASATIAACSTSSRMSVDGDMPRGIDDIACTLRLSQ